VDLYLGSCCLRKYLNSINITIFTSITLNIDSVFQFLTMKISELKPKQGGVEIVAEVVEISDVREFQKFGNPGRVANAKIKDDSGEISLTLWNEQIDQVAVGDKIEIKDGYVNEWQGNLQVTTGRNGTLTKVE